MFPFTHLVWTKKLADQLGVQDRGEFNLGGILSDVRYLTGQTWQATHPPADRFWVEAQQALGQMTDGQYQLELDFARGVLLHLVMDQWEPYLIRQTRAVLPLGRFYPRAVVKLLFEAAVAESNPLENIPLSERTPQLAGLINVADGCWIREFADSALANPVLEEGISFIQEIGVDQQSLKIRVLMRLGTAFLKSPLHDPILDPIKAMLRQQESFLHQQFLADYYAAMSSPVVEETRDAVPVQVLAPESSPRGRPA